MSSLQVLEEFRALPCEERRQVAEAILREEWIPESFRPGMEDIAAGRVMDLKKALADVPVEKGIPTDEGVLSERGLGLL